MTLELQSQTTTAASGSRRSTVKLSTAELEQRNQLLQHMAETGELDRLQQSLFAQLILQDSWREEMNEAMKLAVKESGGIAGVTVDELTARLIPTGINHVPNVIQADAKAKLLEAWQNYYSVNST